MLNAHEDQRHFAHSCGAGMWEVVTSHGHRARDIRLESDARHAVHSLGLTTLVAPGRYLVTDNRGQHFVAEIREQRLTMPVLRFGAQ
jgi:hypothetical protein